MCCGSALLKFVFTIEMSIVPFVLSAAYVEIFDLLAPLGVLSFANVSPLVITMSNSFAISLMESENPNGSSEIRRHGVAVRGRRPRAGRAREELERKGADRDALDGVYCCFGDKGHGEGEGL